MDLVIEKQILVSILIKNRDEHHEKFVKAVALYKQKAVEVLKQNIDNISSGKKLRVYFVLPVPEEHVNDYDRIIRFLAIDTRKEIKLTEQEARNYVDDQWGWTQSYLSNTTSYLASEEIETEED
jgi:hypothetical protein